MAVVVNQVYTVDRNFQRSSVQFAQVQAVPLPVDTQELAFLGLEKTNDTTAIVGGTIERTIELTDVGGPDGFEAKFPTLAEMEAAVANLFQLTFELRCYTASPVAVTTNVVP
jgi:hypothetical protein